MGMIKELITENPNVVFLYNLLGLIYVGQKKIDLAQKYYEKGIEIDPNFAEIYNNLGLLFTHDKPDDDKAENFFKKSISLNQNIPEPVFSSLKNKTYLGIIKIFFVGIIHFH